MTCGQARHAANTDKWSGCLVQLLAQAADALSLGDDVTRQVLQLALPEAQDTWLLLCWGLEHRSTCAGCIGDDKCRRGQLLQVFMWTHYLQVRQYQNWSLMPFAAVIGNVYPATYVRGNRFGFGLYPGEWLRCLHARLARVGASRKPETAAEQPTMACSQCTAGGAVLKVNLEDAGCHCLSSLAGETNFPRFSAWFGANSSAGKQRRLLGELHTRLAASSNFVSDR
jgi:Replication factor RFC1 C terminal domain